MVVDPLTAGGGSVVEPFTSGGGIPGVDVVVVVVLVGAGTHWFSWRHSASGCHWRAVPTSPGNSSGPCQAPVGEITGGVAPVSTSNCSGSHALVKVISVTPASAMVKSLRSLSDCGHWDPSVGME